MSQRDLVAELRTARLPAPPEVRERVRLVAASDSTAHTPRFTWRRALVVAVPLAAAVAATVVFTRPASHEATATPTVVQHLAADAARSASAQKVGAVKVFAVPSARNRVQVYGATLSLRIPTANGVSDAVKRALRITSSLGGYPTSVHASTHGGTATAELTLKVPRVHVQEALAQLSQLGTIASERVDVADKQAGLNATDRLIARLQKQLAAIPATPENAARIAVLTARIAGLQRGEATTRRVAHYATIHLGLSTPPPTAAHGHGPLHGVGVALRWLGIGAVYALAVGLPVGIVLALGWLVVRFVRRRREDALLSSS